MDLEYRIVTKKGKEKWVSDKTQLIEEDKGEMTLALGLRSGDIELQVNVKRKPGKETVKINFP